MRSLLPWLLFVSAAIGLHLSWQLRRCDQERRHWAKEAHEWYTSCSVAVHAIRLAMNESADQVEIRYAVEQLDRRLRAYDAKEPTS